MPNRLKQFFNGENEAFSKIYSRFKKPIFRYVSGRIADDQTAEEITQEVFVKVYRFRHSYDAKHAFSTWLWTIARNTVFDNLRKNKTGNLDRPELIEDLLTLDNLPCPRQNAETLLQKKDLRRLLIKMMRPLTSLQKRVLWMRIVQQRSYSEISKHLGLSLSAAKNLAYRAKLTMAQGVGTTPAFSLS